MPLSKAQHVKRRQLRALSQHENRQLLSTVASSAPSTPAAQTLSGSVNQELLPNASTLQSTPAQTSVNQDPLPMAFSAQISRDIPPTLQNLVASPMLAFSTPSAPASMVPISVNHDIAPPTLQNLVASLATATGGQKLGSIKSITTPSSSVCALSTRRQRDIRTVTGNTIRNALGIIAPNDPFGALELALTSEPLQSNSGESENVPPTQAAKRVRVLENQLRTCRRKIPDLPREGWWQGG